MSSPTNVLVIVNETILHSIDLSYLVVTIPSPSLIRRLFVVYFVYMMRLYNHDHTFLIREVRSRDFGSKFNV
jgi:hypothetical protein